MARITCGSLRTMYAGAVTSAARTLMVYAAVVIGLCGPVVPMSQARADCGIRTAGTLAVEIFLYNEDGQGVLDPDAAIHEGGVYDDSGFVGTVDPLTYDIISPDGESVVGYVTGDGTQGPGL